MKGISYDEWINNFFADVHEEGELIYLHLKLLYLDFMTPLIENVVVNDDLKIAFKEPETRLIYV